MPTRTLPREEWGAYFAAFAHEQDRSGREDYAVLRFAPPIGGGQPETPRRPLRSLTYDPQDDLLEVAVTGLGHFVYRPAALRVNEAGGRLRRLEVIRRDGASEVIELQHGSRAAAPSPLPP